MKTKQIAVLSMVGIAVLIIGIGYIASGGNGGGDVLPVINTIPAEPKVSAKTEQTGRDSAASATVGAAEETEEAVRGTEAYEPALPIELNTATLEDLMWLDGVGEVIGQRIIEYARTTGFYSAEDLLAVKGIGEAKFENISPFVYADPDKVTFVVSIAD